MNTALKQLLLISSPSLTSIAPVLPEGSLVGLGELSDGLVDMLTAKNGYYAFESALHVFPARTVGDHTGMDDWNCFTLWKNRYGEETKSYLFFAEDLFGCQFGVREDGVWRFDPETGDVERHSPDIEGWANQILAEYETETGFPLAHEWQEQHGAEGRS